MPTIQKIIMADISSDQALNGLKIKTDALPNDWYVTLVNPQNGEPGENMTIARFVELLTKKIPVATPDNDGLMSAVDSSYTSVRRISLEPKEEFDMGNFWCEAFTVSHSESGASVLCLLNAFKGCIMIPNGGVIFSNEITEGKIFFGRKETNGNTYVINNTDQRANISIRG